MVVKNLPIKTGHLFIGAAVVMGIITMTLFSSNNGGKKPDKTKPVAVEFKTARVVVPLKPIEAGQMVSLDDITTVKWPADYLPKGETYDSPSEVAGRIAIQNMFPGEPIYGHKLAGVDTAGLPALIPPGYRAVTIAVSEIKGVAGFVKPGDHVDVLATIEVPGATKDDKDKKHTATLLQNVMVLASAQSMMAEREYDVDTPEGVLNGEVENLKQTEEEKAAEAKSNKKSKKEKEADEKEIAKRKKEIEKEKKKKEKERQAAEKRAKLVSSVTLALTPEQVEIVTTAEESAELRLALRSPEDRGTMNLPGATDDDLFGTAMPSLSVDANMIGSAPALPSLPAAPRNSVEMIQGTEKTEVSF
ncbi:MAG: Flp pilus assembly protein CpaB [Candidatus Melainabacteria bacterium]